MLLDNLIQGDDCVQMATMVQLKDMGLLKSQGLIGGNWTDAQDGRTFPVCASQISPIHRCS